MTTEIATVLFDLGGVVCRFHPERRLHALASACGLPDFEVRAKVWDSGFDHDCDQGRYTAQGMYQQIRMLLGLKVGYAEFRSMWSVAFEPNPAMLALVDRLRPELRVGLLTDNGPVLQEAMPMLFPDIDGRFEPMLFSCELGAVKPTAKLFEAVLRRLNERAEQVLLVDDSPRVVQGADAFGLRACLYESLEALPRALAEYGLRIRPPLARSE